MKTATISCFRRPKKRQAGAAVVELALTLPILVSFLLFPMFYAMCFWHYTVAQKAAQDAARYLSTVPQSEMRTPALAEAASEMAVEIAKREIAELAPGSAIRGPSAYCGSDFCGTRNWGDPLPETVRVQLKFSVYDPFGIVDVGWMGAEITANYTLRYAGN
jgi:hypothetical protein